MIPIIIHEWYDKNNEKAVKLNLLYAIVILYLWYTDDIINYLIISLYATIIPLINST
jgi:hypothetical protein